MLFTACLSRHPFSDRKPRWGRQLGADFLSPAIELRFQVIRRLGHRASEILRLPDVFLQIVQFDTVVFQELHEPEIAAPDGAEGRGLACVAVVVMRVVPENLFSLQSTVLFQKWNKAFAIRHMIRRVLHLGHFKDRRIKIRGDHRRVAEAALPSDTRPTDDQRHAHSTFVGRGFAGTKRRVGSDFDHTTIV